MSERVGGVHYDVELNTRKLLDGQREVERAVGRTSASLESLGTVLNAATRAIQLYAAAMAVVKAATLADDMRLLAARVQVASGSVEDGARALTELTAISQRTSTSVAANASTFARLNQSLLQMGGTQADTLRLTELLAKAIKVSGASGVEATSAMLQFGQALGSGKLAGDELRSLLENAPYLMRQLADGLGVPIGALKKMGEEGELTADKVVNALGKAATQIAADFEKFPKTVESAFTALTDAALRANQRFDDMTGASARLSGVLQGLTQFIDSLSGAISGTSRESAELARQNAMQTWATATRTALSYVVDYTDMVWRNIRRIGIAAEGLGTSFGLSLVRDIDGADKALDRMRTRLAEVNNEKSRGAAMRMPDLGQTDPRELARRGRNAGGFSTLTPPGPTNPTTKKPTGAAFDSAGYLAGLEAQTADAWARVGIIESEAKRKADELLAQRKISAEQHAQAVKLIEANAAQERQQLAFDDATKRLEIIEKAGADELEMRLKAKALADALIEGGMTPAEKLRLEEAEKLAALEDALAADYITREKYELAKRALLDGTQAKLKEISDKETADKESAQSKQLQGYGQMFDGMAGMVEAFAGKQNAAYKVLFAASKAFAIAESIIKIQQGIANAASLPFPANLGAMASVAASTASIISTIKGTNYGGGRQYGGPVNSGSLYRVGESNKPEMFVGNSGRQYMIPGEGGRVVPSGQSGAGTVLQVNVTNAHPTAQVTATRNSAGGVDIAIQEVARQIRDNSGPVWSALRGSSNVQGRL